MVHIGRRSIVRVVEISLSGYKIGPFSIVIYKFRWEDEACIHARTQTNETIITLFNDLVK